MLRLERANRRKKAAWPIQHWDTDGLDDSFIKSLFAPDCESDLKVSLFKELNILVVYEYMQ